MLSPAAVISHEQAQQQAATLAKEVGCPTSPSQELVSCLRQQPATVLNDAQTKVGACARSGRVIVWPSPNGKPKRGHVIQPGHTGG